jgi:oxygen-independent coproporphyrinogen-3 oxidase
MQIPHISCYALTVEPRTALDHFIRRKQVPPVDQETQARQFLQLMEWMQAAGYEHYEISNFSLPGLRSRHNSSYWKGCKYLGLGPSAHSFDGQSRQWNIANNALYITSLEKGKIPFEKEILTPLQQLNEYIMTSLRTSEGVDLESVQRRFGQETSEALKGKAGRYIGNQYLSELGKSLVLTWKGKLYADGIAADLFFSEEDQIHHSLQWS